MTRIGGMFAILLQFRRIPTLELILTIVILAHHVQVVIPVAALYVITFDFASDNSKRWARKNFLVISINLSRDPLFFPIRIKSSAKNIEDTILSNKGNPQSVLFNFSPNSFMNRQNKSGDRLQPEQYIS